MQVRANEKGQLLLRAKLTPELMSFYSEFPAYNKYVGRELLIKPLDANIEHLLSYDEAELEFTCEQAKSIVEGLAEKRKAETERLMQKDMLAEQIEDGLECDDYVFARKPMNHQLEAFLLSRNEPYFALFHEQGLGKTKTTIDNACYLFEKKEIDCLVIIAWPNGLHRNWTDYEIPEDVPERIPYDVFAWSSKFGKKRQQKMQKLIDSKEKALKIFAFNVEAFSAEKAKGWLLEILNKNRCMLVIDQSASIKNPSAKRTQFLIREAAKLAPYKRILDGSPIAENPFELFSQFLFLDGSIIGHDTQTGFKAEFCLMRKISSTASAWQQMIVGYKNQDRLMNRINPYIHRATEQECLDLPKRSYKTFTFNLSVNEWKIYEDMRKKQLSFFEDDAIDAPLPIVKSVRMQQIASGWFPSNENFRAIEEKPSRINALMDLIKTFEPNDKVLIFSRFKADMKSIEEALGKECGGYHGETPTEEREVNKRNFQEGDLRFLVGNPATMGIGHTLTAAKHIVFYSNGHSLRFRVESEKRAHRKGQTKNVIIWDLLALGTQDRKIRNTLRSKKEVAEIIMGDPESFFMQEEDE